MGMDKSEILIPYELKFKSKNAFETLLSEEEEPKKKKHKKEEPNAKEEN